MAEGGEPRIACDHCGEFVELRGNVVVVDRQTVLRCPECDEMSLLLDGRQHD